jgi:sterol 3beta-glucosyltransferase
LKTVISVSKSTSIKCGIKLVTSKRSYNFKADSHFHAEEWIDALKVAVFNSKNAGNDIKVVLPFDLICEISVSRTELNQDCLKISAHTEESDQPVEVSFC